MRNKTSLNHLKITHFQESNCFDARLEVLSGDMLTSVHCLVKQSTSLTHNSLNTSASSTWVDYTSVHWTCTCSHQEQLPAAGGWRHDCVIYHVSPPLSQSVSTRRSPRWSPWQRWPGIFARESISLHAGQRQARPTSLPPAAPALWLSPFPTIPSVLLLLLLLLQSSAQNVRTHTHMRISSMAVMVFGFNWISAGMNGWMGGRKIERI